jgi:hypothetical protein
MATTYKIHPAIGIARLGNSPDEFYLSPEAPAALPTTCDARGNPLLSPDGRSELPIQTFKDAQGRVKRQAARFQIWAYDEQSPEGRPLELGAPVAGGGNDGVLVDIQWRVYLANKKASWYEFRQLEGEHGYAPDHPRRNAGITGDEARQRLIIDPGPRVVDLLTRRRASFDRKDSAAVYAPTFPPPLEPRSIKTLGEILTDDTGRLLVLGGHGCSGSFKTDEFGQPRIDTYANNDGWFDDTSDGPVTARLVFYSALVGQTRYVDVEMPAWVVVGYPAYVPEILDMVTMEDVVADLAVRRFAARTDLYGTVGTFDCPQEIDPTDAEALQIWHAGRLDWNPEYKPWFYRDIWPILFRADEFTYLTSILGQSNYPHNQSKRGNFDPFKLSVPPAIDRKGVEQCEQDCRAKHESGELFLVTLAPVLAALESSIRVESARGARIADGEPAGEVMKELQKAVAVAAKTEPAEIERVLDRTVEELFAALRERLPHRVHRQLHQAVVEHVRKHKTGRLLAECKRQCLEAHTHDPYRAYRQYLFDLLRQPGEENHFHLSDKPSSRTHNLPLMPLLAGDNPISNTLPSKFLRLTDLQYYLLRQWALGLFFNEEMEGWAKPDPWRPYAGWVNRTGRDLDRGVLSNVLGGAFCPGGEVGWILRNPAVYAEPYRVKADPAFSSFRQTAAQTNANRGQLPDIAYESYVGDDLSQGDDFDTGLQPGDLTKHMALPWQSDFNECSTQDLNVTYQEWNQIYPASDNDTLLKREQQVWETLWWPAHRPLQTWEVASITNGQPSYRWTDWTRGIPQTNAGDLKMVTEWWRLGFVRLNPYLAPADIKPTELPPDNKYISVERTERSEEDE